MSRKIIPLALLIVVALLSSGCTAGDPKFTPNSPAGFWHGLWHGMIAVIAFIISLFNHDVAVYEVNNNGGWYNFGFLLGVIAVWGSGSGASWKNIKRRQHRQE